MDYDLAWRQGMSGTTTNGIDLGQAHGENTHLGAP